MGSLSIWHWLIVLLVVVLIFGTKKLRNLGGDVGSAVKSFKDAMNDETNASDATAATVVVDRQEVVPVVESKAAEVPAAKAPAKKRAPAAKKTAAAKPVAKKVAAIKTTADKTKVPAKKTSAAKPKAVAKKAES